MPSNEGGEDIHKILGQQEVPQRRRADLILRPGASVVPEAVVGESEVPLVRTIRRPR